MEMYDTSLVTMESVLERTECLWSQCVKPLVAVLHDTFFSVFPNTPYLRYPPSLHAL